MREELWPALDQKGKSYSDISLDQG